jgi:hypothetical protein
MMNTRAGWTILSRAAPTCSSPTGASVGRAYLVPEMGDKNEGAALDKIVFAQQGPDFDRQALRASTARLVVCRWPHDAWCVCVRVRARER